MENYNHRDFSDFHVCFFHHPLSTPPHLYVSCLQTYFFLQHILPKDRGGLPPCVTNCFCGFSSFPSPHFFPSYKPILEGLLLLEQQSEHEWDLESGDEKEFQKLAREPA